MEQCAAPCLRRTFYAVLVGVSPVVFCLIFLAFARLVLYHLELIYNRRQKSSDHRSSFASSQSGRLALSYTPVSHAELQRIIQGEYQSHSSNDLSHRTPKFIKAILPRREAPVSSTSILANLVIRRDAIDASSLTGVLAPLTTPFQPTFSVLNEKDNRRPSVITIKRESVETTTVATPPPPMTLSELTMPKTTTSRDNQKNSVIIEEMTIDSDVSHLDPSMPSTKTMTTTTVVVEEILEFHSVSSLPCALNVLNSIAENDNEKITEIDAENDERS